MHASRWAGIISLMGVSVIAQRLPRIWRHRIARLPILAVATSWALVGCTPDAGSEPATRAAAQQGPPPTVARAGGGASDEDIDAFRHKWDAAVASKDEHAIRALFDWDGVRERAIGDLDVPSAGADAFMDGLWGAMWNEGVGEAVRTGTVELVRQRSTGRGEALQYRMTWDGDSFNYIDLIPGRTRRGELAIVDFATLSSGESVVWAARRGILLLQATMRPDASDAFDRLWNRSVPKDLQTFRAIAAALEGERCDEASRLLDEFSDQIRSAPDFEYYEVNVAQHCSDTRAMRRAIAKFQSRVDPHYPADAYWALQLHLQQGQPSQAAAQLARIAPHVANDPYLDELKNRLLSTPPADRGN